MIFYTNWPVFQGAAYRKMFQRHQMSMQRPKKVHAWLDITFQVFMTGFQHGSYSPKHHFSGIVANAGGNGPYWWRLGCVTCSGAGAPNPEKLPSIPHGSVHVGCGWSRPWSEEAWWSHWIGTVHSCSLTEIAPPVGGAETGNVLPGPWHNGT